ncbi:serpin family protein [Rudaeicoccus suwonensis]|uniref:Serpin B n=1 Tax=Rudaeicoccus suwonensis TaxID=657409 RepID=A0A561EC14_9MICO|nr:serpin family protein [Rudaeicoccus suwonensis]TWE13137.1 serpin B [Rudaeicoccus suwonensis]
MRRREALGLAGAGMLGMALTACGSGRSATSSSTSDAASASPRVGADGVLAVKASRMSPGPASTAGADLTEFGVRLFLADSSIPPTGNGSISPYSAYAALAMTDAGAKGTTAQQLAAAMGGGQQRQAANVTAVDTAIAAAINAGNATSTGAGGAPMVIQAANSLWPDASLHINVAYLRQLAVGYAAGVHVVDYRQDPTAAVGKINAWVAERTHDLIPTLLSNGSVSPATQLEIVNALYLNASWTIPFTKAAAPTDFTTASGGTVKASQMTATSSFGAAHGSGWVSVTVPYVGSGVAMTIVLPDPGCFAAVRAQLASVLPVATAARISGTTPRETGLVHLSMPSFTMTTNSSLVSALRDLGVTQLFDGPDLSGIAGAPGEITVGSVIQQSVVKVDEYGTQAAASTAVGMTAGAVPQVLDSVVVDRAYFYAIHDTTTHAPLFLGQVSDPTT